MLAEEGEGEEAEMQRRRAEFRCSEMIEGYSQRFVFKWYDNHLIDSSEIMTCNITV